MLHGRETEYFLYKIGNKAKMSALTAIMKYCPEDSPQCWTGLLAVHSVFVYRTSLLYHPFLRGSLLDMVFSICIAPQPQNIEYVILLSFCLQYSDGMSLLIVSIFPCMWWVIFLSLPVLPLWCLFLTIWQQCVYV